MDKYFFWCSSSRKEKKKYMYIFFVYLPVAGRNEKKKKFLLKKKCIINEFGLLPNCIVKKKNCIATLSLYCKRKVGCRREGRNTKIVL